MNFMRRSAPILLCVSTFFFSTPLSARLQIHPAEVNIPRELLPLATVVFRGRVVTTLPNSSGPGVAIFAADRWYRGHASPSPAVSFTYNRENLGNGHDCIDLQPGTYWVVFATVRQDGTFDLVHDCYGALSVSPDLSATALPIGRGIQQMEADFKAGLSNSDATMRVKSIQRLGNLRSLTSRSVLRSIVNSGEDSEKQWALLAGLMTGDIKMLPQVATTLANWKFVPGETQGMIALQLQSIANPDAVPGLLVILRSARDNFVKACVLGALGEKIRDRRALRDIAGFLGNSDSSLNWEALVGMSCITHSNKCSLQDRPDQDAAAIAKSCKQWWESEGTKKYPF